MKIKMKKKFKAEWKKGKAENKDEDEEERNNGLRWGRITGNTGDGYGPEEVGLVGGELCRNLGGVV
jgi:hypothetical protein